MKSVLRVDKIYKNYGVIQALDNVTFELNHGEVHGLIGENGAGKTTLVKILSGVEIPTSGKIYIAEQEYIHLNPFISIREGISVIYQDIALFANLTVAENVVLGSNIDHKTHFVNWKNTKKDAKEMLSKVGLDVDISKPLCTLPLAKQQLVAIARAIMLNAKVVIMDEPTSSLSHAEVRNLFKIINTMREQGVSIIFISHKLDELMEISDRFTILRDGKSMGTYYKSELNQKKLIQLMAGRDVEYFTYEKRNRYETQKSVLKLNHLSKKGHYQDISFQLHEKEILGIYGLVGSGRSEVAHSIFGLTKADEGSITFWDKTMTIKSPKQACKLGLAYIPENRLQEGILLEKNVAENIFLARNALEAMLKKREIKEELKKCQSWTENLSIYPKNLLLTGNKFSGGNQQKIVVGKWLNTYPKVLIVDEPTNGIDIETKTEIHKMLRNLSDEGVSIIIISSELPEIIAISDRVLVMKRGRLEAELKGEEIETENIMKHASIGLSKI